MQVEFRKYFNRLLKKNKTVNSKSKFKIKTDGASQTEIKLLKPNLDNVESLF